MIERRPWTEADAMIVEQMLRGDAYQLLTEDYIREHAARLTTRLTKDACDWDETQRIRGELKGLALFAAEAIRQKYPPKSDKP